MKNILRNIIILILFMIFPVVVSASGNITASPSSLTIEVGSTKTFTITAINTIGDVSISSSNSAVASVSSSSWGTGMVEEGQTKTGSITVTGLSVGSSTITLILDAATFDAEDLSGQSRTVVVNVVAKQTPVTPSTPSTPSTPTTPSQTTPSTNNQNNKAEEKNEDKSQNNNLKDLTVDGYNVKKVDNNNYTLDVSNDVSSINIKAVAEDSKAKVSGDGKHDLNIGENNIEIVITSESGKENKINVKVNRKDAIYLEDLDNALNSKIEEIMVNIKSDSKLSSSDLTKIKNSKKIVSFNYYDENKKIIYTWILDGSKINDFEELEMGITFKSDNEKKISKLSNYADGLYLNMKHNGSVPNGTKLKIYVGNKFSDKDKVNIYHYDKNNNNLEEISKGVKVKDGYVEFDIKKCSDYFITMSTIGALKDSKSASKTSLVLPIVLIVITLLVIFGFVIYVLKNKKSKSSKITNDSNVFPVK